MTDEENQGVEAQESQAVAPAEQPETVQEASPKEQAQERKRRNDAEYNWAEANKKMQELSRQNKEMQSQLSRLNKPPEQPIDDEIDRLADDELMTKAQARKLAERMARQVTEQVIKQREAATVDERLGLKFSDFTEVVNEESVGLLKEQEPELFYSITTNPDPYAQGVAAYKLMKKMGIQAPEKPGPEREKAIKNAAKPVSVNAVTKQSAIGNVHHFENGLTKEIKSQLWKEMQQAAKMG